MTKKFISILAIIVLAVCLVSGGCVPPDKEELQSWQDLLKIKPDEETTDTTDSAVDLENNTNGDLADNAEKITVDLYFISPDGKNLVMENRAIVKQEGIARSTIEELIKGPQKQENLSVFPDGTRLLDINIKPDGRCIVDLSSELTAVSNEHQEKLMLYALVNTLGQFPTVQEVEILINGQKVDSIAGYIDVSAPLKPDYSI
ncbi:MAG: GerMN domain-containing protein [Syntrophomonadaceae bacterium]|nr:GerMN domain-containing protein [Syntrophomonadaceae bacterium]